MINPLDGVKIVNQDLNIKFVPSVKKLMSTDESMRARIKKMRELKFKSAKKLKLLRAKKRVI